MDLEVGNWKQEIGDWRLEIGDWRLEIRLEALDAHYQLPTARSLQSVAYPTSPVASLLYVNSYFRRERALLRELENKERLEWQTQVKKK